MDVRINLAKNEIAQLKWMNFFYNAFCTKIYIFRCRIFKLQHVRRYYYKYLLEKETE